MSNKQIPPIGSISWCDLTVENAGAIRDFYSNVVGWTVTEVEMGGHRDYCMNVPENGKCVAGVCHALGENSNLPPAWLVYITVANLDTSLERCAASGGKIRAAARSLGAAGRFAVIEDPAGAVAALFEAARPS